MPRCITTEGRRQHDGGAKRESQLGSRETQRLNEEAAWVAQALSGEAQGFEALMRRYHVSLGRVLRAILRNPEDAEDVLQETFLRAFRYLHRFDPKRPFGPWLLRIGANLARNHLRRRKARPEVSLDETPETSNDERFEGSWLADLSTVEGVEYQQLCEATRRALESLPEDQRVVLEMRLLAEMSYKEISAGLDIPIGTVMSRLNRGRRRMQSELTEYGRRIRIPEVP
ncbi:RNA polymerase sigma factor [Candidatus Eisenbacteria bacterium]|uniref:RNA polymerase sigma factor n=1 Tax=Eiseniibacteriota bacterium TaxID=2212470 RepID=A0ABV6YKS8_UNCEI